MLQCEVRNRHWVWSVYNTAQGVIVLTRAVGCVQAVLAYPMGVVRLMDMMAEREVVRNEALLLMIVLTHANAEVQKIAAFEGAFERLFSIIRSVVA
jgi:hypothetical protein